MIVRTAINQEDIEDLKPIVLQWKAECNGDGMGISLVPDRHYAGLASLIERENAALFLLLVEGVVVGYMGIEYFKSPLGDQRIANEHYWYVLEKFRGRGSLKLVDCARWWAKRQGCSHLIMNASTLASGLHDKVCRFYERIGMQKFETSYIKEIV